MKERKARFSPGWAIIGGKNGGVDRRCVYRCLVHYVDYSRCHWDLFEYLMMELRRCGFGGVLHTVVSPGLDILVEWIGQLETLKNQIMPFYQVNIVICTHRDRKMDPGVAAW